KLLTVHMRNRFRHSHGGSGSESTHSPRWPPALLPLEGGHVLAKSSLIPTWHADEFQAELPLAGPANRCHIDRQWCGRGSLIRQNELQGHVVACSHVHLAVHRTAPRRQVIDGAFANLYSICYQGDWELNPKPWEVPSFIRPARFRHG